jgi:hypothetical protein
MKIIGYERKADHVPLHLIRSKSHQSAISWYSLLSVEPSFNKKSTFNENTKYREKKERREKKPGRCLRHTKNLGRQAGDAQSSGPKGCPHGFPKGSIRGSCH